MKRILYILAIALSILACTDEIDKSNRYTFTGETMMDYLLNRSDKYSHFIEVLRKADMLSSLQTYGQYTLFLPDNDAIEVYLAEQDSIYQEYKDTETPVWTGITSPLLEDLSDSMANVISRTHLVEARFLTAQFGEGALTKWNMNDRYLGVSYRVCSEDYHIMINNSSAIVGSDNEVENGIVHIIDRVIDSSMEQLPELISKMPYFTIFTEALKATGFADSLRLIMDPEYSAQSSSLRFPYPAHKYYKYTGFIEPDEVFRANGISNLADLRAFCEKWYGTEDSSNPKSPRNALFKFVAYHFVDRELPYEKLTVNKFGKEELYYPLYDQYDYFETAMGKLIKVTKPLSTADGRDTFINYSKRQMPYNSEMRKHLNVRIVETTEFIQSDERYADFRQYATNGIIHPIDRILVYNEDEMAGNILNERLRIDLFSLLPEVSSNNIRFNQTLWGKPQRLPFDYCKNLKDHIGAEYFIYYAYYTYYLQDILGIKGAYDFSIKLPPVPTRTYELRLSTIRPTSEYHTEGWGDMFQVYLDGKVCGLPIDMRIPTRDPLIGWIDDNETYDNGVENDKEMRNRGWMKAPDSYLVPSFNGLVPARDNNMLVRRILTRLYLPEGEHWLRFRLIEHTATPGEEQENFITTVSFDYIELVPLHIVSDPSKPEDRH